MIGRFKRAVRAFRQGDPWPDVDGWQREIAAKVAPYTMASFEQALATIAAVAYIHRAGVPGDFVECGVWRGGQSMAAILTLQRLGGARDIHLFDTFEGMTPPDDVDVDFTGKPASSVHQKLAVRAKGERWCEASQEEVRENIGSLGYPMERVHFWRGDVRDTIPEAAPEQVAFLRLDTDWYESTLHELEHLYPRVPKGGVVTVDDYGHWQGARKATDEYLGRSGAMPLLYRIDYTGRQWVKA
ncbi:MAG: hypothetical protein ABS41_07940 [Arenimonas sp. SCN 70-307]|uniref:TylF/MycF/NovP-related O-methyltransferase n=1 Tax=Arenimonas sp. SCN 70-307 TaxID=1660089 RepID=UPI00086946C3|nr:TylF/MycF/NovP-related O-methyltransferase [Arenimonas sp. SCN 70-307]ODS63091.1 MAG: hypothetical protein ABS41_07940 [Arenimonas sp. SCN 70-307]